MAGYAKLFARILDSTIWREDDTTRILWITMLALADQDGIVHCTIPGLADRARVTLLQCEYALERFQQPDKYSWSKEDEGRRIRPVEGGWFLVNHSKYRALMSKDEQREKTRVRVQRWRDSKKMLQPVTVVTSDASNDIADTEAEADTEAKIKGGPVTLDSASLPSVVTPVTGDFTATPTSLNAREYALKLLSEIEFPADHQNMQQVAETIKAEIKSGKSAAAAYEFVLAGTLDARDEGYEINTFFFRDMKHRAENRGAKRNGNQPAVSASVARAERTKQNIIDGITADARRRNQSDGPERQIGAAKRIGV